MSFNSRCKFFLSFNNGTSGLFELVGCSDFRSDRDVIVVESLLVDWKTSLEAGHAFSPSSSE